MESMRANVAGTTRDARGRGGTKAKAKAERDGRRGARCATTTRARCRTFARARSVTVGERDGDDRLELGESKRTKSLQMPRGTTTTTRAMSGGEAGGATIELEAAAEFAKDEFYTKSFVVKARERVEASVKVRVETNGVKYKVTVETDMDAEGQDLRMHWGVATSKETWDNMETPPVKIRPPFTIETTGVCQTRMTPTSSRLSPTLTATIEGDVADGFYAINFLFKEPKKDRWIHNTNGRDWHVPIPQPPEPELVTRTITMLEDYEEEIEEDEEYEYEEEQEEQELDESLASLSSVVEVNIDLNARASSPVKEEVVSAASSEISEPANAWKRLLTPPVDPKPFDTKDENINALVESLFGAGSNGLTSIKPIAARDEGPPEDEDSEPELELAKAAPMEKPKTLKTGMRKVNRMVTKSRTITKSIDEPLPVKLVEGPWLTTNTIEEKLIREKEVSYRVGAVVEKNVEGGGVLVRVEAELPWNIVLHWGIVPRGARADVWTLPPEQWRPEGSVVGDTGKACETPMKKCENPLSDRIQMSYAELQLGNAPTAMRFVLKENGGEGRWLDRNGDDFVIPMPEPAYASTTLDLTGERTKEAIDVATAAAFRAAELHLDSMDEVEEKELDMNMQVEYEVATPPLSEDDFAPAERIQKPQKSAVGNGREVLLQGFNWESWKAPWYQAVERLAPTIAELGFTVVWLPPPTSSVSEQGYMPLDYYNLDSRYGTKEELKGAIKALHDTGVMALGDAVLNHRCAHFIGDVPGTYNKFGGKLPWDATAIVADDPNFHGRGNKADGEMFHAAPNIDHNQAFVKADLEDWMSWLMREVGYDGWRLDYVRGFWGGHVKDYMEATNPQFAVGEYWDSLAYNMDALDYNQDGHRQRIVNWLNAAGGNAGAFDVTTKGILHAVFERQEYWRLSDKAGKPPGVMGWWPSRAVTFIENHDTGSTQGHWRFPRDKELQGYAYILTHPGTPTIFWDHIFDNNWGHLHKPIEDMIRIRKQSGIHCRSEVKIVKCEQSVYAAVIDDRLLMKIGPGHFHADDAWDCVLSGQDFAIWRKKKDRSQPR